MTGNRAEETQRGRFILYTDYFPLHDILYPRFGFRFVRTQRDVPDGESVWISIFEDSGS